MVSQGEIETDDPDDHAVSTPAVPEETVLEWYGTLPRDGRTAEAAFVATDRRLIYVTEAAETAIEYTRIQSVEASVIEDDIATSGYRDLALGAAAFAAAGFAIVVWSDHVIGSVVGVIGMLIGVLLALDVLRNLHDHSGRMTLETPIHRLEVELADGDPLSITTTADVTAELREVVDPDR